MTHGQERLLAAAVDEVKRDPQFGRELRKAIDSALPRKARRRQPAAIDVFATYEATGEHGLRRMLEELSLDQLKDVVAEHRMDRANLAMKWKTPARLVDLITTQTVNRAHKGEAFLGD